MILHINSIKGFMVTVIGWLVSAIILFSLVGIEVRQHQQTQSGDALVYTQNFFAGIMSAGLYLVVAVLLSIYIVSMQVSPLGPADRRKVECTSIVLRVIIFAILLLGGAALYSTIEGWSLMDALYFTNYTLLTIGLGNLVPRTHLGRSLLIPYAFSGIASLGFVITAVASFTDQMRELKLKFKIEEAQSECDNTDPLENTIGGISTNEEIQLQTTLARSRIPRDKEVFKLLNVKSAFYRRRRWTELALFLAAWFALWLLSAQIFHHSEKENNWTYFVALYFTCTSLTTIGYGDYTPTTNFSKVFFIFWSLLAIPILTNLVTVIGDVFHIWLIYCSGWVRRRYLFHRGRIEKHHDHEYAFYSCRTLGLAVTASRSPIQGSRNYDLSFEDWGRSNSESRQGSPSVQVNYARSDLCGDEQRQNIPRWFSAQYRLLLLKEIENLIPMVRDDSFEPQEELCCTWSRIIPLLHAKADTVNFAELAPPFVPARPEHTMMGMPRNPKEKLSERNAEISWMLSLLLDKLSSDFRKELSETIE